MLAGLSKLYRHSDTFQSFEQIMYGDETRKCQAPLNIARMICEIHLATVVLRTSNVKQQSSQSYTLCYFLGVILDFDYFFCD